MSVAEARDPTAADAGEIARLTLGREASSIVRFETGASHFVYDLSFPDGTDAVVRIGRTDRTASIAGGVYWSKLLRPRGVPLPELLASDLSCARVPFPFMVLERLPGRDLWAVYGELTPQARRRLAFRLASIQERVTSLPAAAGFGFAPSLEGPFPHRRWADVVAGQLARNRRWIEQAGLLDPGQADAVARAAEGFAGVFERVVPTPFLHDITTKNVIIGDGALTGVVDVDDLCFGDPLFLLALINMALLAHERDTDYVGFWKEALAFEAGDEAVLAFYTALFCLAFMGEIGQRFNRAAPSAFDPAYAERLERILQESLRAARA